MDSNKLRVKPIMLPYTQLADSYDSIKLLYREQISSYEYGRDGRTTQILIGKMGYLPQHLYLVSTKVIKINDWVFDGGLEMLFQAVHDFSVDYAEKNNIWRIEATTDPSLGLPLIPHSFIEKWVDKQGKIKYVHIDLGAMIINGNNWDDIIIIPVKDSWNREEIRKGMLGALNLGMMVRQDQLNGIEYRSGNEVFDEWFDKNY